MTFGVFVSNLLAYVDMSVIYVGLIKSVVFGILIGLIACFYGYNVTGGAQGVGKASNNTVVHGIVAVAVANYFLTSFLLQVTN
ncbi:putative phospholipid ABC transporter permease protein MlaE [compost metagenome]